MESTEAQQQFALLTIHRRNLAYLLEQKALSGMMHNVELNNSIQLERQSIKSRKDILRKYQYGVEDLADDIETVSITIRPDEDEVVLLMSKEVFTAIQTLVGQYNINLNAFLVGAE